MKNDDILSEKKFKIIEPFLTGEKKLREIEQESEVSYATLKRWVKSYKDDGLNGLNKKERIDKNNHKKINSKELLSIKNFYLNNNSLSISKLFEKYSEISEKINISYPTFYRIINNLDTYVKKSSEFHIRKIEKYGASYGLFQHPLYFPFHSNKIFYINLFFEIPSLKIVNFYFDKEAKTFKKLYPFIRESILKSGSYPKEIFLTKTISEASKNSLRQCFFESSINFLIDEEFDLNELNKFCGFIEEDLSHEFYGYKDLSEKEVQSFLEKYIFMGQEASKEIEFDLQRKLDFFLNKSIRKVYKYGIRMKNFVYFNDVFKDMENEILEIKHSTFNEESVVVYKEEDFLCIAQKTGELVEED